MYNRYIPQPDGTYRRSLHPDKEKTPVRCDAPDPMPPFEQPQAETPRQPTCPPPQPKQRPQGPCRPVSPKKGKPEPESMHIGGFLKSLLPRDFDTGDLIVILLLLLMSSDCGEGQNTALLTLALYLFL